MGARMLKFTGFKRQEINLVFKIKVFVGSKIWYFNKSIYFYFLKIWVVTIINTMPHHLSPPKPLLHTHFPST
jgi:hypothetical protein